MKSPERITTREARRRRTQLEVWWGVAAMALGAATWRLWVPRPAYPQVPLVAAADAIPLWLEAAALMIAAGGLLAVVVLGRIALRRPHSPRWREASRTAALLALAGALGLLIMVNQHRLQPWAYQGMLFAVLLAASPPRWSIRLLRVLAISLYAYSALGKFDAQFLHTVGLRMLGVLAGSVGLDPSLWPASIRMALTAAFPSLELLVALALVLPRTRRAGVFGATAMHGTLLWILGPLGLAHQPGVLLWNVFFIGQAWILFWPTAQTPEGSEPAEGASDREPIPWLALAVTAAAALLPLLERRGGFDHWTSWALYSPHSSRAQVQVSRAAAARLRPAMAPWLQPPEADDPWVTLAIDAWSVDALGVPIYPQDRFQLGVALAVAQRFELDREIRVELRGVADRWDGRRTRRLLQGRPALQGAADSFRFNARPRSG